MMTFLLVLHFLACFVLITVVLLQRGKGADLGAALGGGGANTVFGGRGAGNFLTKITTGSAIVFMLTSMSLAYIGSQDAGVQLFDDADIEAEESQPAGLENVGEEESAAGGLEDVGDDLDGLEDVGGLEEIPRPGDGGSE